MLSRYLQRVSDILGGFRNSTELELAEYCWRMGYTPKGAAQYIRS